MTILIGYTPSEPAQAALGQGLDLARLTGEPAVILNAGPGGDNRHSSQLAEKDKVVLQEKLNAASDVHTEYREYLRGRSTVDEFVALCAELDPSFVVVGNKRRSGFGRFVMGSVTDELLRALDHPVLCVKTPISARPEQLPQTAEPEEETDGVTDVTAVDDAGADELEQAGPADTRSLEQSEQQNSPER